MMKKTITKTIAVTVAAVLLVAMAAGCRREPENLYVPPEFVFVANAVTLNSDSYINNLVYSNDKLFYSTYEEKSDESNPYSYSTTPLLFSMNIDGSGLTQLSAYKHSATLPKDASGGLYINNMIFDKDGNLWIVETWDYTIFNLPDSFDPMMESPWDHQSEYSNGTAIRKLDTSGAEIMTVDISHLKGDMDYFYIQAFSIDTPGNIYISVYDDQIGGQVIYVLSNDGSVQFDLRINGWFSGFVQLADGSMAISAESNDDAGNYSRVLQRIDFAAKAFGESYDVPTRAYQLLPGSGSYDFLYADSGNLYGFTLGAEEPVKLLNWLESDVMESDIRNITMLSDDKIICTNQIWDMNGSVYELLTLTRVPYSELPQRQVITLATYGGWSVRDAVIKFNRENSEYRIHVLDYAEFSDQNDWSAGLKRLNTELISGTVPDILDVSSLPFKEYAAKGMLADMYAFIDSDPEYSRSDFIEGAFHAAEIDGKLYQVFTSFYLNTIAGRPDVLGSEPGWNMDEFQRVLSDNPNADMPLGQWLTKESFLQSAVSYNIDEYIDWAAGTANFDNLEFIQLLKFANTFPNDLNRGDGGGPKPRGDILVIDTPPVEISQEEAIATGRQIMVQLTIYDYWDFMWYKNLFGGEIVFKGFPTENKRGTSLMVGSGLAIMEKSPNKDAAWSYVRGYLDKDTQLSGYYGGMLTNKAAFNQRAQEAMEHDYQYAPMVSQADGTFSYDYDNYQTQKLTQADVDQILDAVNRASGTSGWNVEEDIWNIILEEVSGYFTGSGSAEDAARVIQSRLSILVSERS